MPATHKVLLGVDPAQPGSDLTVIHMAVPCTGSAGGMRMLQEAAEMRLRPMRERLMALVERTILDHQWKRWQQVIRRTISARRARTLRRQGICCTPAPRTSTGKARYYYTWFK